MTQKQNGVSKKPITIVKKTQTTKHFFVQFNYLKKLAMHVLWSEAELYK